MASSYYQNPPPGPSVMSPELQQAQSRLQQTERSYSQTQSELMQAMKVRPKTPIEVSTRNEEIAHLQERLRTTEAEMDRLKELVERQKATIKHQSDQIAHPKQHYPTPNTNRYGSRSDMQLPPPPPPIFNQSMSTNTPHNRPGPIQPTTQPTHQRQHSSPFGGPRNQQPIRQHQGSLTQPTPLRQPRNVNEFGSPEALTQSFADMRVANTPMGSSNQSNLTPGSSSRSQARGPPSGASRPSPAPTFNPANGMALNRTSDTGQAGVSGPGVAPEDLVKKFADVFSMAEMYAYTHVNTPSTHRDGELPPAIKSLLLSAASENSAFRFMSTPFTRYILVWKVIVQFLLKTILRHDAFVGFDAQVDANIDRYRKQIFGSTPAPIRFQFLTAIANEFKRVQSRLDFQDGVYKLARERGNELHPVLEKMMYGKTSRHWEDLFDLMLNAYELAEMMASSTDEYRFVWPKIGDRLCKSTMAARDPYPNVLSAAELERRGATVKLGITPLITLRTTTAMGDVQEAQILPAFVLMETTRS